MNFPKEIAGAGDRRIDEIKHLIKTDSQFSKEFDGFFLSLKKALLVNKLHRALTFDSEFYSAEQLGKIRMIYELLKRDSHRSI